MTFVFCPVCLVTEARAVLLNSADVLPWSCIAETSQKEVTLRGGGTDFALQMCKCGCRAKVSVGPHAEVGLALH